MELEDRNVGASVLARAGSRQSVRSGQQGMRVHDTNLGRTSGTLAPTSKLMIKLAEACGADRGHHQETRKDRDRRRLSEGAHAGGGVRRRRISFGKAVSGLGGNHSAGGRQGAVADRRRVVRKKRSRTDRRLPQARRPGCRSGSGPPASARRPHGDGRPRPSWPGKARQCSH